MLLLLLLYGDDCWLFRRFHHTCTLIRVFFFLSNVFRRCRMPHAASTLIEYYAYTGRLFIIITRGALGFPYISYEILCVVALKRADETTYIVHKKMSFLLLYTQWMCLHFFRVLDVRKFAVVCRFGYNSVGRHSLAGTHLSGFARICAHIGICLETSTNLYGMFHSRWSASSLGDLST